MKTFKHALSVIFGIVAFILGVVLLSTVEIQEHGYGLFFFLILVFVLSILFSVALSDPEYLIRLILPASCIVLAWLTYVGIKTDSGLSTRALKAKTGSYLGTFFELQDRYDRYCLRKDNAHVE